MTGHRPWQGLTRRRREPAGREVLFVDGPLACRIDTVTDTTIIVEVPRYEPVFIAEEMDACGAVPYASDTYVYHVYPCWIFGRDVWVATTRYPPSSDDISRIIRHAGPNVIAWIQDQPLGTNEHLDRINHAYASGGVSISGTFSGGGGEYATEPMYGGRGGSSSFGPAAAGGGGGAGSSNTVHYGGRGGSVSAGGSFASGGGCGGDGGRYYSRDNISFDPRNYVEDEGMYSGYEPVPDKYRKRMPMQRCTGVCWYADQGFPRCPMGECVHEH